MLACLNICMCTVCIVCRPKEGTGSSETGVIEGWELLHAYRKLIESVSSGRVAMISTTELSLHTPYFLLSGYFCHHTRTESENSERGPVCLVEAQSSE